MDRGWLLILVFVLLVWDLYRLYRNRALRRWLMHFHSPHPPGKPRVMKPKSELDCPECQAEKLHPVEATSSTSTPSLGSAEETRRTQETPIDPGEFLSQSSMSYYGVTDEQIHALVGDGVHRKHEVIRDFYYQAYHTKVQRNRS